MLRHWKIFVSIAAMILAFTARKFLAMAILMILLPVYAMLLVSIFLILFVALASAIVPLARAVLNRYELPDTRVTSKTVQENDGKQEAA